jgi:hypothetical protein
VTPLFRKLNLTTQRVIHVLGAPESFEREIAALAAVEVRRELGGPCAFALAFVAAQRELDALSAQLASARPGDAIVWVAYPKKSSRQYRCDFDRDSGWTVLGQSGFEPVRQVAIDEDWSALRFRRVEFIKTMTRNPAGTISTAGRAKARRQRGG